MTDYQNIKRLFAEIEKCNGADVPEYFSQVTDLFPLLIKIKQNECAHTFYLWAGDHAVEQPLKFGYAKFLLALNYFFSDQHEKAVHLVTEAKSLFQELNDREGTGCCLALMGGIYRTLGNYDLALKTLWEGYRQLKLSGIYSHFISACSYNLGNIYFEMQNVEEAIHLFNSTLAQSEKTRDHFWSNYALHGLGKVYLSQKNYVEAKNVFEKAVSNAREKNNALAICNSLTELANYYFQTGHYSESEQLHEEALVIREQNHFIGGAITNYIRLGETLIMHRQHERALVILEKGLGLAEQIKVNPKIYQIHLLLSILYEHKNDLEKGLFHYKKFHEIREEVEVEDCTIKIRNVQVVFEAEQTQKENIIIKKQKAEIERKNIELQDTIDELTMAKIGKKAKAFTLMIAIVFFIFEDTILHFTLNILSTDNYFLSLVVKMAIIFSLSPINKALEKYLLKRVIKNKTPNREAGPMEIGFESSESPSYLPT